MWIIGQLNLWQDRDWNLEAIFKRHYIDGYGVAYCQNV